MVSHPKTGKEALANLRDARLLAPADSDNPDTIDCHPLIREYFGGRLKEENPQAWREAHSRLYEYYKTQAPEFPDTLDAMLPLYAAVAHGCQAGRYQETLDEVYLRRISRLNDFFSVAKLGAFGADLAALAGFFAPPWLRLVVELRESAQGFVLNQAGRILEALGRLAEAVEPMQRGLEAAIARESWDNASIAATNLCGLSLNLGRLGQARDYALQAAKLVGYGEDEFQKIACRTYLARVSFQQGRLIKAKKLFQQSEKMQQKRQPQYPFLYSLQGYYFCDLLLSLERYWEVQELVVKNIEGAKKRGLIRDIALGYLSMGQAYLSQALADGSSDFTQAATSLDQAVAALRQAGDETYVVLGLLARAGLDRVKENWERAHHDLQEAMARAKRSGMALLQADAHLEYARLHLAQGQPEKARPHLATAKKMIAEIGYGRRKQDVLDLEDQLRRTH